MANATLCALLGTTIDFAGTFPPAQWPLEKTLRRAATFRNDGGHPWLMHRVALPWKDIRSLSGETLRQAGGTGAPWNFAIIGGTEMATVQKELTEIWDWRRWALAQVPPMRMGSYETACAKTYRSHLTDLLVSAERLMMTGDAVLYIEVAVDDPSLDEIGQIFRETKYEVGLKVRTGGQQIPSATQLARVIDLGRRYQLPFKATQGLHETLSHGENFGFVNLFSALNFAYADDSFSVASIESCLEETEAHSFRFEADGLAWRDHKITLEAIYKARTLHQGSFGSCSIDEPDENLAKTFAE